MCRIGHTREWSNCKASAGKQAAETTFEVAGQRRRRRLSDSVRSFNAKTCRWGDGQLMLK
ncbi:hypothetical protein HPP92_026372, partial [Vanilla planifolia]